MSELNRTAAAFRDATPPTSPNDLLSMGEAVADDVEAARQKALNFIREIAADCEGVSRIEGIEIAEKRTWLSIAKRCKQFLSEHGVSSPVGGVSLAEEAEHQKCWCGSEGRTLACPIHGDPEWHDIPDDPPPSVEHILQMEREPGDKGKKEPQAANTVVLQKTLLTDVIRELEGYQTILRERIPRVDRLISKLEKMI